MSVRLYFRECKCNFYLFKIVKTALPKKWMETKWRDSKKYGEINDRVVPILLGSKADRAVPIVLGDWEAGIPATCYAHSSYCILNVQVRLGLGGSMAMVVMGRKRSWKTGWWYTCSSKPVSWSRYSKVLGDCCFEEVLPSWRYVCRLQTLKPYISNPQHLQQVNTGSVVAVRCEMCIQIFFEFFNLSHSILYLCFGNSAINLECTWGTNMCWIDSYHFCGERCPFDWDRLCVRFYALLSIGLFTFKFLGIIASSGLAQIAVEGCAHGDLDNIYATLQYLEGVENIKIDLLICCGDFQVP